MNNALWENIFPSKDKNKQMNQILNENILFSDLSKKELSFVNNIVHVRNYTAGEKIFSQGEIGVGMYIIISGSVDIIVENSTTLSGELKNIFITRLMHGDFFGELSLIEENSRRSASAIAHENSKLIGFFKPDLMEILERNPNIGVKIVFRLAEILGQRLIKTTEKVSVLRKELHNLADSPDQHNSENLGL